MFSGMEEVFRYIKIEYIIALVFVVVVALYVNRKRDEKIPGQANWC